MPAFHLCSPFSDRSVQLQIRFVAGFPSTSPAEAGLGFAFALVVEFGYLWLLAVVPVPVIAVPGIVERLADSGLLAEFVLPAPAEGLEEAIGRVA